MNAFWLLTYKQYKHFHKHENSKSVTLTSRSVSGMGIVQLKILDQYLVNIKYQLGQVKGSENIHI